MLLTHSLQTFPQLCLLKQMDRRMDKHPFLLMNLLNIYPQQCLLRQMDRLLEKHLDAFDTFIADYPSIMFAKTNGSTLGETP